MFVEKLDKVEFKKYHLVIENEVEHMALTTILRDHPRPTNYRYIGNEPQSFADRLLSMIQSGGMGK